MSQSKFWYLLAYLFIACVGILIGQLGLPYQLATIALCHFIAVVTMLEFRTARNRGYALRMRRGTMKRRDAVATETCWMTIALAIAMTLTYALLAPERLHVAFFAASPALYVVVGAVRLVKTRRPGKPSRPQAPDPMSQRGFIRVPGAPV